MNKEKVKKYLASLFTTGKGNNEDDVIIVFQDEYMHRENAEKYAIYKAVSGAQHNSGLSFDFSDEISSRAVDVLVEVDDWEDDDAITEAIDGQIPIYTHDIMKIYQSDSWAVDEARKEFGSDNSEKDAQMAWYSQIRQMVYVIKENLMEVIDESDTSLICSEPNCYELQTGDGEYCQKHYLVKK